LLETILFTKAFAIKDGKEIRKKKNNDKYCGAPCSLGVKNNLIANKKAHNEITDKGIIYLNTIFIFFLQILIKKPHSTGACLYIGRVTHLGRNNENINH